MVLLIMSWEATFNAPDQLVIADSLYTDRQYDEAITEYKRYVFQYGNSILLDSVYLQIALSYRYLGKIDNSNKFLSLSLANTISESKVSLINIDKAVNQIIKNDFHSASNILLSVLQSTTDTQAIIQANYYLLIIDVLNSDYKSAKQRFLEDFQRIDTSKRVYENHKEIIALLDSVSNIRYKDVKKAKLYSSFLPGLGQLYCKNCKNGVNAFLLNAGMVTLVTVSIINAQYGGTLVWFYFLQLFYFGNRYRTETICANYNKAIDQGIQKAIFIELSKPYCSHNDFK